MSIILASLLLTTAQQTEFKTVQIDPWLVSKDTSANSCTMRAQHSSGTTIAFTRATNGAGVLGFSNPTWASLSKSQESDLRIGVNEYPYKFYNAVVMKQAIVGRFEGVALNRLADQKTLSLFFKGQPLVVINTDASTQVALRQLDLCANYLADPFAK